jgi:hydroxymethylbilane synthase
LKRLGLADRITALIPTDVSLPAAGQGAIGIECRADRADLLELLAPLNHASTGLTVRAERALARALAGSCNVPLAAFAEVSGDSMRLRGYVGSPDGSRIARGFVDGPVLDPEALGIALAAQLREAGAAEILAALESSDVR